MPYSSDREKLNQILISTKDIRKNKNILTQIIPELIICIGCQQNMPAHIHDVFDHILETVHGVENDLLLKITALFHDIGKPYTKITTNGVDSFKGHERISKIITGLVLKRLGYDKDFIKQVSTLVKYHDYQIIPTPKGVQEVINIIGDNLMPYFFNFQESDISAHSEVICKSQLPKLYKAKKIYILKEY